MSSLEKPAGLSSLVGVGAKTERTTRALQARFLELVEKVRQTRPASDIELLRRSFDFAAEQHSAQLRKSGDPYLSHPLEVAHILADMKLDITTLCAALLHDVVEDTHISTQTHCRAVRAGHRAPGRRRHEDQSPGPAGSRGAPGRKRPQDASGDGQRRSRRRREAGRPSAQHAHAGISCGRKNSNALRAKRSISMRPSRTAWEWA